MSRFEELEKLVADLKDDFAKFYEKDNQAAGTRVRKGMQDLKVLAQEIRKEVQDMKNKAAAKKPAAKKPAAKKDAGKAKKK